MPATTRIRRLCSGARLGIAWPRLFFGPLDVKRVGAAAIAGPARPSAAEVAALALVPADALDARLGAITINGEACAAAAAAAGIGGFWSRPLDRTTFYPERVAALAPTASAADLVALRARPRE